MFKEAIEKAAEKFKQLPQPIRIISHFDSDGLASAAIITKLMQLEDISFQLSVVKHFDETLAKELSYEDYKTIIFTDIGSGQLKLINTYLKNREIVILDHHRPQEEAIDAIHVNPHLYGISGEREISGAGVTFLFAQAVNKKIEDYAHLALIGAIGDMQERRGFIGLNKEILQIAVKSKKIIIKQDLQLYGSFGRSISKIIEYSSNIPGISGDREKVLKFLKELKIDSNLKLYELSDEQKEILGKAIVAKGKPENSVFGPIFILPNEKKSSPFYDIREFSTLLNACGRLEKQDLGIAALLGNKESKILALHTLSQYKEDLMNAIQWFNENKEKNTDIISKGKYVIINATDKIVPNIVGTLASIISKSVHHNYDFIVTLSQFLTGQTKVSFRKNRDKKYDLRDFAKVVFADIDKASYGGHMNAVGAVIPTSEEDKLIEKLKIELDKLCI